MPTFNLFETISFALFSQAVTYCLFLILKQRQKADIFLTGFLAVLTLVVVNLFLRDRWLNFPIPYFYFEYVALLSSLQFLYVKGVVNRQFTFERAQLRHFAGFAIVVISRLCFYLFTDDAKNVLFEKYLVIPLFIYCYYYLFLSIREINQFHRTILLTQSSFDKFNLKWLKYELIILGFYFASLGVESIAIFVDLGVLYEFTVLISFLSMLLFVNFLIYKSLQTPVVNGVSKEDIEIAISKKNKYKNSRLSIEESKQLFAGLIAYIEKEKPYRQFILSLEDIAKLVNLSRPILSQIINENANKNFNDFINHYRVKEAKQLLANPHKKLLIKEVMYECGFQSSSTFNAAFKRVTGMSPSAYQKSKQ